MPSSKSTNEALGFIEDILISERYPLAFIEVDKGGFVGKISHIIFKKIKNVHVRNCIACQGCLSGLYDYLRYCYLQTLIL